MLFQKKRSWKKIEDVVFYEFSKDSGTTLNSSLVLNDKLGGPLCNTYKENMIQTVNLESFVCKEGIDVDLIKIDVEGSEYDILKSSLDFLKKQKPVLFIEYISKRLRHLGISDEDFKLILSDIYDCYEVKFPYYNEHPVLDPFFFDRDIETDIICFPKI